MNSRIFSAAFYRESLRRIKTPSIVFAILLPIISLFSAIMLYSPDFNGSSVVYTATDNFMLGIYVTLIVPIMTLSLWSYLHKRCESDYYEVLPVRRSAMVISGMLAVFTVAFLTVILSVGAYILFTLPLFGTYVFYSIGSVASELAIISLAILIGIFASTISVSVTGTGTNSFIVTAIILLAPYCFISEFFRCVAAVMGNIADSILFPYFTYSSNAYFAVSAFGINSNDTCCLVTSSVIAVIYFLLALILFKRRRSECATYSFVSLGVARVISLILASAIAVFGIYIYYGSILLIPSILSGTFSALAVYFIYIFVTTRKMSGKAISAALSTVICFAVISYVGLSYIVGGALSSKNECSEDTESISFVEVYSESTIFPIEYSVHEAALLNLSSERFDSLEILSLINKAIGREDDGTAYSVVVRFYCQDSSYYRNVTLTDEEYESLVCHLAKDERYRNACLRVISDSVYSCVYSEFSYRGEFADKVIRAILSDIDESGFDSYINSALDFSADDHIQLLSPYGNEYLNVVFPIGNNLENTSKLLDEMNTDERKDALERIVSYIGSADGNDSIMFDFVSASTDDYKTLYVMVKDNRDELIELLSMVDPEMPVAEGDYFIYIYTSYDYSGSFALKTDADIDRVVELLKIMSE